MAITSNRSVVIANAGDITYNNTFAAAANALAPADEDIMSLSAGNNTITVPGGGATVVGATLIPPAGNTQALTLKGVAGDTGISLHKTDPTSIGLNAVATFVINAAGIVNGFRIVWT